MPSSRANPPPTDRALARLRLDSRLEPVRAHRAALATPPRRVAARDAPRSRHELEGYGRSARQRPEQRFPA